MLYNILKTYPYTYKYKYYLYMYISQTGFPPFNTSENGT